MSTETIFWIAYVIIAVVTGYWWAKTTFTGSHGNTSPGALKSGNLFTALSTGALYGACWPLFAFVLFCYGVVWFGKQELGRKIGTRLFGKPH